MLVAMASLRPQREQKMTPNRISFVLVLFLSRRYKLHTPPSSSGYLDLEQAHLPFIFISILKNV